MHAAVRTTLMGVLAVAGGCEAPPPAADGPGGGETAAISGEAVPHEEARFLARAGGGVYRVNVRYVDIIDQSVIVVREGGSESGDGWPLIEASGLAAPSDRPFGSKAWEPFAVGVAERVAEQEGICPEGATMRLDRKKGAPRTLFRDNRQAWVVFAACPGAAKG